MQPPSVQKHDNPTPAHPPNQPQEPSDVGLFPLFKPFKPPLRERGLVQLTKRIVLLLSAGIVSAAVTVWWFLPTQLPWLR